MQMFLTLRGNLKLTLSVGASALILASAAQATESVRVPVGDPGNNTTQAFASSLVVQLISPTDYSTGCCTDSDSGEWLGPNYVASDDPSLTGQSSIDWSVDFVKGSGAEAAARRALIQNFGSNVSSAAVTVNHMVGSQLVGTLSGYAIVNRAASPSTIDAEHEGVVAIPLSSSVIATARFSLLAPYADSTGTGGSFLVGSGSTLASVWNGTQAATSLANVTLDGNLPPATVTARATSSRRKVSGKVKDSFGAPLVGQTVKLQRRTSRGWRTIATGTTSSTGSYSITASSRSRYRAYVKLGGTTKHSRTVNAGR